ncbi:MAG: HAMP domain-containing histidine kinase [Lachnospiraceae bacterium]|nr:HAMP domain-containing histidine kinase [Lachnospiraceae bacterium]
MVTILVSFICIAIVVYFLKRERKLTSRMQEMLDNAASGVFEDKYLDESKISLLENTMWRYICDNRLLYTELSDEKEQMQKLVSDISHQAVTPVSNIILYSQLLEEELLSMEEHNVKEAVESIHAIMEQAGKMDFFLQMLVKLSRMENGIISVKPLKQSISSILQALGKQYGLKAKQKNIKLHIESSEETAVFDKKWTIEAAANIVDNAIKYTPEGGNVYISVIPYSMFLRLDVSDSGIGIKEAEQGKIFTRFYRSDTVHGEQGAGIGLYIAREVMRAQYGYIKVTSEERNGSTFSLFFLRHELSQK